MPVVIFEEATFDKIIAYLAEENGLSVLETLQNPSILNLNKKHLTSWTDLGQILDSLTSDIFGFEEDSPVQLLIDYGELKFDSKVLNYLENINQDQLFLYTSAENLNNAETKKALKKAKAELISLKKIDEQKQLDLATDYRNQLQLMISTQDLNQIVKNCSTYQEVIDALDYLRLSDNPKSAINELILESATPLFWLGFEVEKLPSQITQWLKNVTENDLQLALNLISTKLEKQNTKNSRALLKQLILTDNNLKNSTKIGQMTWWKYFLWTASKV